MRSLSAATIASAWLCALPAANAQAQLPPASPSDPTPNFSDQKLDAAGAALKQVASIKKDYQQRIEGASPTDRERIAGEAENALMKAVTDQGLSVAEYNSIMVVAQNDPEVREKILQHARSSE
jgi:hypothetical protein